MTGSPSPDPSSDSGAVLCSARGCAAPASFDVLWNNPKIHPVDRRKHWFACAGHRESLSSFLAARGFLRSVEPISQPGEQG